MSSDPIYCRRWLASIALFFFYSLDLVANDLPWLEDIPDSVLMSPPQGATPLLAAVIRQEIGTIEHLLKNGSDPNQGIDAVYFPLCSALFGLRGLRGDLPAERMTILRMLIAHGANNEITCYQNYTPLTLAFELDARNAIRVLLDARMRVGESNIPDVMRYGLWRATKDNDLDLLTLLLKSGVPPDFSGEKNTPPALLQAVEYLRVDMIRALLDAGASIHAATYLHAAVKQRVANTDVLRMLLDAGADPNQLDEEGFPPLVWAAYYNLAPLARMLLEAGAQADVHSRSGQVLLEQLSNWTQKPAAMEIVDALIKAGANPHYLPEAPLKGQKTPFVSAIIRADIALLERYLTLGADLDRLYVSEDYLRCKEARAKPRPTRGLVIIPWFEQVALDGCEAEEIPALLRAIKLNKPEVFAWLLQHGADPRILVGGKVSLLEYAARRSTGEPFADMLIAADISVDIVTYSGWPISKRSMLRPAIWQPPEGKSPEQPILTAAALGGHLSIVNKLIAAGADPNKRAAGDATPMHCLAAAEPGGLVKYHKAARALLAAGADLSLFDEDGYTPVTRVLSGNDISLIELILEQEFDVNKPDGSGRTPLAVAIEFNGRKSVVHTLLRKGARVGAHELALVKKTDFPSLITLVESAAE